MSHRCPGKSCTTRVSDRELCCRRHWFQLMPSLRAKIRKTADQPITDPRRRQLLEEVLKVINPK